MRRRGVLLDYTRLASGSRVPREQLAASEMAYLAVGELPLTGVVLDEVNGYSGHRGWKWKERP